MRRRRPTSAAACAVSLAALAGCATPAAPPLHLRAVALAAEASPEALRMGAERGDAEAQLALSLALAHGLHGLARDAVNAQAWRARATAPRGGSSVVAYTPAFRGHPSHVRLTPAPRPALSAFEAELAARCAEALPGPGDAAVAACGPQADVGHLAEVWRSAGG